MSESDQLLADLWAQDEPSARDPVFVVAVMERAARRRLWVGLAALLPAILAMGAVSWALAPVVQQAVMAALPRLAAPALDAVAAAVVMAAFLWSWASDRLQPLTV